MPPVALGQLIVAQVKDVLQHSLFRPLPGVGQLPVMDKLVALRRGLFKASFVHGLNTPERKGVGLDPLEVQLVHTELLGAPLAVQPLLEGGGFLPEHLIFLMGQAQEYRRAHPDVGPIAPLVGAPVDVVKGAHPVEVHLLEIHLLSLLFLHFFPAQRQQPVVDPLVVGVPHQPPALQTVLHRQLVNLGGPPADVGIAILVHVLGLDDLLRAIPAQEGKKLVQAHGVIHPHRGREGAARQGVGDIRFQRTLGHIDHPGAGIADKVDGIPRRDPHRLARGGEGEIFDPGLLRRVSLLFDGVIQPDL